jgi:hypothetical protein
MLASLGCTQIPKTPPYAPGVGMKMCSALRKTAVDRSTEEFVAGAALAIVGAAGVGAGIAMGPDTDPSAAWHERSGFLFVIAPSVAVAAVGLGTVARAQRTESLADQATSAIADGQHEADRNLYYECVSARGDWSGNHSEIARIHSNMSKEHMSAVMTAQETASNAQTQAQSASSLATDAKAVSVKAMQTASASAQATKGVVVAAEKLIEATPKKDGDPAIRDARAALSEAKENLTPRPEGSAPRPQAPVSAPLEKQR